MPKTYDPIVSTIPVVIKTSANSFELTNFVKFDRITAITTKNKQPIKTAIHKKQTNQLKFSTNLLTKIKHPSLMS